MATTLMTMFASFVGFVGGVILITEFINKLFKVENGRVKWVISWVLSLGLSAIGFWQQIGFFADCGDITQWQGWVKTILIGVGCAFAANKTYDANEIWNALEWLFSFFNKGGKAIRANLREEQNRKRELKK